MEAKSRQTDIKMTARKLRRVINEVRGKAVTDAQTMLRFMPYFAAKIVAIADTYHALTSDRPYRKGMNIEKAISILEEGAGTQWDADLVRTFVSIAPSLGV